MKLEPAVKRETLYIAAWCAGLSVILQLVFLLIGKWNYSVLLGNLLGIAAAVGNFLLMGITVQKAVEKSKEDAAQYIRFSQTMRLLLLLGVGVLGILLPCFSVWTVLIPLFFPRIAILFRPMFNRFIKED